MRDVIESSKLKKKTYRNAICRQEQSYLMQRNACSEFCQFVIMTNLSRASAQRESDCLGISAYGTVGGTKFDDHSMRSYSLPRS